MSYDYWLNVITTNKAAGDQLASAVGNDVGDGRTFDVAAVACYAPGTTFASVQDGPLVRKVASTAPIAWAVAVAVRKAAYDVAAEFATGGYPATLLAAGFTPAQLDALRAVVRVQAGSRELFEGRLAEFVASNGYLIQE